MADPQELAPVLWKLEHGFDNISADHVRGLVKWARSLEAENAELRARVEALTKEFVHG